MNLRVAVWTALAIVVAVVSLSIYQRPEPRPQAEDAYQGCATEVLKRIPTPATAKFPGFDAVRVIPQRPDTIAVVAYVDAENLAGALVRTEFLCVTHPISATGWIIDTLALIPR